MLRIRFVAAALALGLVIAASPAQAASILFVSDSGADLGIATALMADGHDVTTRMGEWAAGSNPALREDLSAYDAVYWSQDGTGSGDAVTDALLFENLTDYVLSGGRVLVTGYDSVASPSDPMLVAFLGASGSGDVVGAPGAIAMIDNSLTIGVVDVRGVTPTGGVGDTDHLTGLMADTVAVANSASGSGAQITLRTLGSGEIAYVSNGSSSPSWTNTSPGGAGAFNAIIRNFAGAADAGSTEAGAPQIEFDRVYSGDEGAAIAVMVTVTDLEGDAVTYSWDLNGDGTFDENVGVPSYTIPADSTDGPGQVALSVHATDGAHSSTRTRTVRIRNVAPRITSDPPTTTSVGAMLRYRVEATDPGGALDPLTYRVVRGPEGAAFTDDGTFVWNPTDLDVTDPGEMLTIEIAVDDGDAGTASQVWDMTVSPNHAPGAVSLLYPANGIAISDPLPRLVVSNASDIDLQDTITYFFQLDDEETFADPVLVTAERVEQGTGYTAYQLTEPLPVGRYHWRAWSFDGAAQSEPMQTTFLVVPDPDADAGPIATPDGGGEVDAGVMHIGPPSDRGCSCAVPGAQGGSSAPLAMLGLIALASIAVGRRRR